MITMGRIGRSLLSLVKPVNFTELDPVSISLDGYHVAIKDAHVYAHQIWGNFYVRYNGRTIYHEKNTPIINEDGSLVSSLSSSLVAASDKSRRLRYEKERKQFQEGWGPLFRESVIGHSNGKSNQESYSFNLTDADKQVL